MNTKSKGSVIAAVIIFLSATIFASVLLSNKAGINLHHDHKFSISSSYTMSCSGYFNKTCSVYFHDTVAEPDRYAKLVNFLKSAKSSTTVHFYVAGRGGYVSTSNILYAAISTSKAKTITHLIGDAYSAHALLVVSGKEIRVDNKFALIMFHRSSIYDIEDVQATCKKEYEGKKDRRQDLVKKCVDYTNALLEQDKAMVITIYSAVLTPDEVKRVLRGEDVFLTGHDIHERLS